MRFIILTISLLVASNTYAAIDNYRYIYQDDGNKISLLKEELRVAKSELAEGNLEIFSREIKNNYQHYAKDEIVYIVGDTSKKDVGAKIGMTKDQVINKTHWGEPDGIHTITDDSDVLDSWTYDIFGDRNGITQSTGTLYFLNGKLIHRMSGS
ncbi:hypothetical protein KPY62_13475 [Psychrobacter sp. TAE2020]|uniref:hypothetical protein n=1 Tax=Psychrobacter sp. TAE2020 TaxID=2846762 RepID=UPI001C1289A6|nr:hypothetical protein [Psychrobacter sp. TAE2020]MBU5618082.1 hypothetical protein [Psychrobacter sp. TAE2020]